jgi:nucleolar complex protein 2
MIKRWLKDEESDRNGNRNRKINTAIKLVVHKIELNAKYVEEKRQKVDFAPNNRAGVEAFLKEVEWEKMPLGAFVLGQRTTRAQKEKVLKNGRAAQEKKRSNKNQEDSDEEEGGGGGGFVDAEDEEGVESEDDE